MHRTPQKFEVVEFHSTHFHYLRFHFNVLFFGVFSFFFLFFPLLLNSLSGCPIAAAEKLAISQEKNQLESPKAGQCQDQTHRYEPSGTSVSKVFLHKICRLLLVSTEVSQYSMMDLCKAKCLDCISKVISSFLLVLVSMADIKCNRHIF